MKKGIIAALSLGLVVVMGQPLAKEYSYVINKSCDSAAGSKEQKKYHLSILNTANPSGCSFSQFTKRAPVMVTFPNANPPRPGYKGFIVDTQPGRESPDLLQVIVSSPSTKNSQAAASVNEAQAAPLSSATTPSAATSVTNR